VTLPTTDLSFDPRDPYYAVPGEDGLRWAVQVFTADNGYGIDPDTVRLEHPGQDRLRLVAGGYARLGQQTAAGAGRVEVVAHRRDGAVTFEVAADHSESVKSIKLLLRGLPAAGWWSPTTPRDTLDTGRFQWTYPGPEWATRWAASGTGAGAVTLSVRDVAVHATALHVHQPPYADGPIVEVVVAAPANDRGRRFVAPPVRLLRADGPGALDADLDDHLRFVEDAYDLRPWEARADVPAWLHDTALVVTLHGQHWTGHVFNTFDQMAQALKFVADHIEPHRVLAYLPGWEGRYYHAYPDYRPGAALGGDVGFAALTATARELGVRLMPMFGANGVHVARYPAWRDAVIRNDTDLYADLLNRPDWDGDRFGEGDQVFLSPGEPAFRGHLADRISAVVDEFGVDAAFLDTAGFWFDDPRHPLLPGYRQLVATLRERHPGLLVAAEGWWDAMLGLFPLNQQWLGVSRDVRAPRLLTRYARTTAHLAEGTPGSGSTGVHEEGFRPRPAHRALPGHLPVVGFAGDTLVDHAEEVAAICRRAHQ
jgi:hypothetical protein